MNNYSDEQLAAAYLKGDRAALNLLIRRYLTPIFNYALKASQSDLMARLLARPGSKDLLVNRWKKNYYGNRHFHAAAITK